MLFLEEEEKYPLFFISTPGWKSEAKSLKKKDFF